MKKIISVLSVFFLFLSSVSCESKKENLTDNSNKIKYITRLDNSYDDGRIIGASAQASNCNLQYLKYQDMSTTALCSRPNCNHKTDECVAKQIGSCPILKDDYIYFFDSKSEVIERKDGQRVFEIDSRLCRLSLDSSEIETVAEFTDCVPREYDGCMLIGDVLWFTGDDMNPVTDEYGVIFTSNVGGTHYLCSIELETGSYTNYGSVYNGENYDKSSHASILGYYNSNLLINYEYETSPDCYDGEKAWFGMGELMFEFDLNTKEMKISDIPTRPLWFDFDSDTLVYCEYDTEKTVVLRDNKKIELDIDTGSFVSVFNNKIFVRDTGKWYDLTDSSEHDMSEYANSWDFVDYYENCYIVTNYKKYIKLTEEELLALDKEDKP